MRLQSSMRAVATNALIAIVLTVLLLGSACDARCIHPVTNHACCPSAGAGSQASPAVTSMIGCNHLMGAFSGAVISSAISVCPYVISTPVEQARYQGSSEREVVLPSSSPPLFHLRI
jgi:hypothetical protein